MSLIVLSKQKSWWSRWPTTVLSLKLKTGIEMGNVGGNKKVLLKNCIIILGPMLVKKNKNKQKIITFIVLLALEKLQRLKIRPF